MGYWSKDGGYVVEDGDIERHEFAVASEGQTRADYERRQAGLKAMQEYEENQKKSAEAEREFAAKSKEEDYIMEKQRARELQQQMEQQRQILKEQDNRRRYGTDFDLRNPESLSDRRARANFWRTQNNWNTFIGRITGKNKKFEDLWSEFSMAKTEEERLQIVEKMEKMYPTTEKAIQGVENRRKGGR